MRYSSKQSRGNGQNTPSPKGRDRIMNLEEFERLFTFLQPTARRQALMLPLVKLALETAMRRGEILSLH